MIEPENVAASLDTESGSPSGLSSPPPGMPQRDRSASSLSRLARLARFVDVRTGEGRIVVNAFAILLFLVAGHTMLETARDTLLLKQMNPRALGVVYLAVAAVALPAGFAAARLNARVGPKRALIVSLVVSVLAVVSLFFTRATDTSAIVLYVTSALIGSVLVSQFWSLLTSVLTVTQGRRLLSPIAAAGVIGGVVGSGGAALMVSMLHTRPLLLVAGGAFAGCAVLTAFLRVETEVRSVNTPPPSTQTPSLAATSQGRLTAIRRDPYVVRVAMLAVLSTAAVLAIDYLFKWSVAQSIPKDHLGVFLSRYYAAVNVLSLVVQLFVGAALVQRIGVTASLVVTPMLLLGGGIVSVAFGGTLLAVMLVKGIDGSLRHSIHRTSSELLYMPVLPHVRARVKPLIDGPFVRTAQAAVAVVFLAMGELNVASWKTLGAAVLLLCSAWVVLASTMRRSYLRVFREALAAGAADATVPFGKLDLGTAELLMEHLASNDFAHVVGAMHVLVRSDHVRLIPALVLLHDDERVVVAALKILDASTRTDWFRLAERLLQDNREQVRLGAMRALARHRQTEKFATLGGDLSDRARGYAMYYLVATPSSADAPLDPRVANLFAEESREGEMARHGFFAALADAPPSESATRLLRMMQAQARRDMSPVFTELLAQAASEHEAEFLIPTLIERLELRAGRDALRTALVHFGEPALDAIWETMQDATKHRRLRVHLPRTMSRFGTARAAELLLTSVETEKDGLVRYKAIRGLGRLVNDRDVRFDRKRVERLCKRNLIESLRILALMVPLAPQMHNMADHANVIATRRLLTGLLDDKLKQSLERAFRLLKVLYRREDIHRVHWAANSTDKRARANAGEFLDALLAGREHQELRQLFRLMTDDFSPRDRVTRATAFFVAPAAHGCEKTEFAEKLVAPRTAEDALAILVRDNDVMVAALAVAHATALGGSLSREAVNQPEATRANVRGQTLRLFSPPKITPVPNG